MYFVIEIQKWADGTWHNIAYQYEDKMQAFSKFHYIMSEAAVAKIPVNGAIVFDGKLNVLMKDEYQHGEYEGYTEDAEE